MGNDNIPPPLSSGSILPPMFPPLDGVPPTTAPPVTPGPLFSAIPSPPPAAPKPSPSFDASTDIPWHQWFTHTVWRYAGTLVMDTDARGDRVVSFGRLSATLLMIQAMILWRNGGEISGTMMQTLTMLLVYNLGNKGLSALQTLADAKKQQSGSAP